MRSTRGLAEVLLLETSRPWSRVLLASGGALVVLVASGGLASAQLWEPLDVVPKPNAIVGIDSSVTMGIDAACVNCHSAGDPATRLAMVQSSILGSLPLFQDYFVFGGFEYSGCGFARIVNRALPPDPNDAAGSLARTQTLIQNARHCGTRERYFEGMGSPKPNGCATPNCTGEVAVAQQLLNGDLYGFDPFEPWRVMHCIGPTGIPASVSDPCAWWPPKPPLYQPPAQMQTCYCDAACHHGDNGTDFWVWESCSSCSTTANCPIQQFCNGASCSPDPAGVRVPCTGGWCPPSTRPNSICQSDGYVKKWINKNQLSPTQCLGPPPPPIDLYPDWGIPNTPMEWSEIPIVLNKRPPEAGPLYPEYVNAPTCDADPVNGGDSWCINHAIQCASGGSEFPFNLLLSLLADFPKPRWYQRTLDAATIEAEFCTPLRAVVGQVRARMQACSGGRLVVLPDPTKPEFCNAAKLAGDVDPNRAVCLPGSPLFDTCICDDSDPGCSRDWSNDTSACGHPLDFKARQQVAVCETYNPGQLGGYYSSQADNRYVGGCRENFGMLFTDGYMGDTAGVATEGAAALPFYSSLSGASNLFVFRVSNVFNAGADALMAALGQPTASFDATDPLLVQGSMARILNRAYQGVYLGTSPGRDQYFSRMAVHAFTVRGDALATPSDEYLGWPARISWYAVGHDGTVGRLIFDTDQSDKVQGAAACGPISLGGTDPAILGPGGSFRNGVARNAAVGANTIDRDGDGTPDTHPALTWGGMFSVGSTRPVVVEGPRDAAVHGAAYADYNAARTRPRMIYVMSNGYVHGFHAGQHMNSPAIFGDQRLAFSYDDSVAAAGVEMLRYRPGWLQDPRVRYQYPLNDLIQQPMITGQLLAREVAVPDGAGGYVMRTVLVGAQGRTGPGYFALDITNPCATSLLAEWTLPGATDSASGEPQIGVVTLGSPLRVPVVISTGGLGGTPTLYAHDLMTGTQLFSRGLPGGGAASYPTGAICVDVTAEGRTTHCYVLREDGLLLRVPVDNGGFGAPVDITPLAGVIGAGRRFGVTPTAFFGLNGEVNLVFGSGNFEDLDQADAPNFLFKVVDKGTRDAAGVSSARAELATACGAASSGQVALGAGERIISRPMVSNDVIAWTTFNPSSSACASGSTSLYAMDFETCRDLVTPANARPAGTNVGDGLPTSPTLHEQSQSLVVATSAGPTGSDVASIRAQMTESYPKTVARMRWTDSR